MTEQVKFDKKKHEYTYNGKHVLSVTSVLPDIPEFLMYKQSFMEKTWLGSHVHEVADVINNYYMTNNEVPDVDYYTNKKSNPKDEPYIKAYVRFLLDHGPVIKQSECRVFHEAYCYAGTLDLLARVNGKWSVNDIKTSTSVAPYARLQLAAYVRAWNHGHKNFEVFHRNVIHLLPTGKYKVISYTVASLKTDFDFFVCKLKSAQWDAENMRGYAY